jgi:hypothetical protein
MKSIRWGRPIGSLLIRQGYQRREDLGSYWEIAIPRYPYFVHVDKDVLESVVYMDPQPPGLDLDGIGYVNLVPARLHPGEHLSLLNFPRRSKKRRKDTKP